MIEACGVWADNSKSGGDEGMPYDSGADRINRSIGSLGVSNMYIKETDGL